MRTLNSARKYSDENVVMVLGQKIRCSVPIISSMLDTWSVVVVVIIIIIIIIIGRCGRVVKGKAIPLTGREGP
jgi:hypothetical protein